MENINSNQNVPDFVAKGEQIYKQEIVDKNKDKELVGQYVAIDIETREVFIGITKEESLKKASTRYPNKIFYVRRIGSLDAVSARIYSPARV